MVYFVGVINIIVIIVGSIDKKRNKNIKPKYFYSLLYLILCFIIY